jgi:hypothetical protein
MKTSNLYFWKIIFMTRQDPYFIKVPNVQILTVTKKHAE